MRPSLSVCLPATAVGEQKLVREGATLQRGVDGWIVSRRSHPPGFPTGLTVGLGRGQPLDLTHFSEHSRENDSLAGVSESSAVEVP